MKKKLFFGGSILIIVFVMVWWIVESRKIAEAPVRVLDSPIELPIVQDETKDVKQSSVAPPLERVGERVTKKPFGIWIDVATSPIQPERFRGYHTGVDLETFSDEATTDVPVMALCAGEILVKRSASGYGGVLVTRCVIDEQNVTVVYGHLKLASITENVGDTLVTGDIIGVLGTGASSETDGERKHLHIGIHKGDTIDLRGYVVSERGLAEWLPPCQFFRCSQ